MNPEASDSGYSAAGEPGGGGVVEAHPIPISATRCTWPALNGSWPVYDELAAEFARTFGRRHDAVEAYLTDDAEFAFVMLGSFATKAREAVDRLRDAGWKIGLVRPRLLRPFPEARLREILAAAPRGLRLKLCTRRR